MRKANYSPNMMVFLKLTVYFGRYLINDVSAPQIVVIFEGQI